MKCNNKIHGTKSSAKYLKFRLSDVLLKNLSGITRQSWRQKKRWMSEFRYADFMAMYKHIGLVRGDAVSCTFQPEHGGPRLVRNVGIHFQIFTVAYPRRM